MEVLETVQDSYATLLHKRLEAINQQANNKAISDEYFRSLRSCLMIVRDQSTHYFGQGSLGQIEGLGYVYDGKEIHFQGQFADGLPEGYAEIHTKDLFLHGEFSKGGIARIACLCTKHPKMNVFMGQVFEEKPHGFCRLYYPEQNSRSAFESTGTYDRGRRVGLHYERSKSHEFTGEFQADERHGFGFLKTADTSYLGNFSHGIYSQVGVLRTAKYQYLGEFADGQMSGVGEFYAPTTKSTYRGGFKRDLFNGYGILETESDVYSGDFVDNLKQGFGRMDYKDGCIYIGKWLSDKREGKGMYIQKDSVIFGQWKNDLLHGMAIRQQSNSSDKSYSYYEAGKRMEREVDPNDFNSFEKKFSKAPYSNYEQVSEDFEGSVIADIEGLRKKLKKLEKEQYEKMKEYEKSSSGLESHKSAVARELDVLNDKIEAFSESFEDKFEVDNFAPLHKEMKDKRIHVLYMTLSRRAGEASLSAGKNKISTSRDRKKSKSPKKSPKRESGKKSSSPGKSTVPAIDSSKPQWQSPRDDEIDDPDRKGKGRASKRESSAAKRMQDTSPYRSGDFNKANQKPTGPKPGDKNRMKTTYDPIFKKRRRGDDNDSEESDAPLYKIGNYLGYVDKTDRLFEEPQKPEEVQEPVSNSTAVVEKPNNNVARDESPEPKIAVPPENKTLESKTSVNQIVKDKPTTDVEKNYTPSETILKNEVSPPPMKKSSSNAGRGSILSVLALQKLSDEKRKSNPNIADNKDAEQPALSDPTKNSSVDNIQKKESQKHMDSPIDQDNQQAREDTRLPEAKAELKENSDDQLSVKADSPTTKMYLDSDNKPNNAQNHEEESGEHPRKKYERADSKSSFKTLKSVSYDDSVHIMPEVAQSKQEKTSFTVADYNKMNKKFDQLAGLKANIMDGLVDRVLDAAVDNTIAVQKAARAEQEKELSIIEGAIKGTKRQSQRAIEELEMVKSAIQSNMIHVQTPDEVKKSFAEEIKTQKQ
jgi:hypothetical protein